MLSGGLTELFCCVLDGPIPLRIREAEIPIVSETECVRKINAVTEKIFILPTSTFCAGGELGNDACQVRIGDKSDLGLKEKNKRKKEEKSTTGTAASLQ